MKLSLHSVPHRPQDHWAEGKQIRGLWGDAIWSNPADKITLPSHGGGCCAGTDNAYGIEGFRVLQEIR